MTTAVEMRTDDTAWIARVGATPGRAGRVVITVPTVERLTFAGVEHVRFDLAALGRLPRDWSRHAMLPAAWVV